MAQNINRRDFIKNGSLALTSAAMAITACDSQDTQKETSPRYAMLIDLRKCYGCHSCSVACKSQFNVPLGVWRSWVKVAEKGKFPNTKINYLPVLCNHCENPPCVPVCPTGATFKRKDGIVVVNEDDCVGCEYCVQNCPYQARFLHPYKKVVNKCDFCVERISGGVEPSCVNTCPARARVFGDINDPDSEISKLIAKNPVQTLKEGMGTKPRVYYINLDDESVFNEHNTMVN